VDDEQQRHIRLLRRWSRECGFFEAVDWGVVYAFLVGCACEKLRYCPPDSVVCGIGMKPRDFAWDVCVLELQGGLAWDGRPMQTGAMCGFLRTVMLNDIIDALRVSTPSGKAVVLDIEQATGAVEQRAISQIALEPTDPIALREGDGSIQTFLEDLAARPDPHPQFLRYVRLMLRKAGLPPRQAATLLGISVKEVNEMRRRLKRRMRRFWPEDLKSRARSRRPRRLE
jgi:DNA-directed RNA polymerase specialized sigma24 family protein